tara:strand:- start:107 stop:1069 length:963 start_codon:yes stop_codon:yes gene_type:complete
VSVDVIEDLNFLKFIIDRVNIGIIIIDKEMKIHLWNQFMVSHTNVPQEELINKDLFEAFPELPRRWFRKKINSVFMLKNFAFTSWEQRSYLFKMPHNRPVTGGVETMQQDCTLMPLKDASGEVQYICIAIQDATDVSIYQNMLKEALTKLEQSSRIDGLTQIFNRTHWEHRLAEEFDRVKRYGGSLSLIMFDLDHFKKVNDTYGHLVGDDVLRATSKLIKKLLRTSDVPGRYGGEEFGILLPNTDLEGALQVAERIREECDAAVVTCEDVELGFSVSMGVTQLSDAVENHENLIHQADTALYHSKKSGRNCVSAYRPEMS